MKFSAETSDVARRKFVLGTLMLAIQDTMNGHVRPNEEAVVRRAVRYGAGMRIQPSEYRGLLRTKIGDLIAEAKALEG